MSASSNSMVLNVLRFNPMSRVIKSARSSKHDSCIHHFALLLGEKLCAAIDHHSSFSPCSSNSPPSIQRICSFNWTTPIQPTVESFNLPLKFGNARGRPAAPVQNRQFDVRQGKKRTFWETINTPDSLRSFTRQAEGNMKVFTNKIMNTLLIHR